MQEVLRGVGCPHQTQAGTSEMGMIFHILLETQLKLNVFLNETVSRFSLQPVVIVSHFKLQCF